MLDRRSINAAAVVRVLEADPDLLGDLPPNERERAVRESVARTAQIPLGRWDPPAASPGQFAGQLGLLVLEGVLTRDVELGRSPCAELLGPGDILRPWHHEAEISPFPVSSHWTVIERTRVAVLDRRFTRTIGQWPEVVAGIYGRAWLRVRRLALQVAIAQLNRVDLRLLVLFWRMADRWGRVRRDGVLVGVRLTQAQLAHIVGAQRPSVTLALRELAEAGLISRQPDGCWVLHGQPPDVRRILSGRTRTPLPPDA